MTSAEFQEKNRDYAHTNDRTVVIKELDAGVTAVRRSVGSRDRPEHRARPLRGGRDRVRAQRAEARRHRDRRRRAHRVLHDADGGDGRRRTAPSTRSNRSTRTRICSSDRFARTGSTIASSSGAQRSAPAAGTATLTFPVETLNTGGAYLLRDGTAPLAGQPDEETCPSWRSTTAAPAAGPVHQDGRRRRRAAGGAGRGAAARARIGRSSCRSCTRRSSIARRAPTPTPSCPRCARRATARICIEHGQIGAPLDRAPAGALVSVVLLPM